MSILPGNCDFANAIINTKSRNLHNICASSQFYEITTTFLREMAKSLGHSARIQVKDGQISPTNKNDAIDEQNNSQMFPKEV